MIGGEVSCSRAVVCSEPYSAKLSRQHNDTNILAFGARVIGIEMEKMTVDAWLEAEFEGGRHQRRVNMIAEIEKKNLSYNNTSFLIVLSEIWVFRK